MKAIVALAVAMLAVQAPAEHAASAVVLPPEFAAYKTWTALLEVPRPVSQRLWMMCMMPSEAQWEQERAAKGPPADGYVMVYGNAGAVAGLKPGANRFPVGTVIAKEKRLPFTTVTTVAGVAFMVKRSDPRFADTGGWSARSPRIERATARAGLVSGHSLEHLCGAAACGALAVFAADRSTDAARC